MSRLQPCQTQLWAQTVAPDNLGLHETAKGTQRAWFEGGIYENDYVRENGIWKIKVLRYFPFWHGSFDEAEPQLVQDLFEDLTLFGREVAARLLVEQREDFDHLRGTVKVHFRALSRNRIRQVAEMDGRRAGER